MIVSFGDKITEDLYHGLQTKRTRRIPKELWINVCRKLDLIQSAQEIQDLQAPPGNRLEMLKGEFRNFHSIRINNQWRIIFRWHDGAAHEVRIMDYH